MIAKLVVEGKEFDIEILDPKLQELIAPKKKTGYERVNNGEMFYSVRADGTIFDPIENHGITHDLYYSIANYYSSADVAEDNSRADELMHQLRRFAVEHRKNNIDWDNCDQRKFYIGYDCQRKVFDIECDTDYITSHTIYFDSYESAEDAMHIFASELKWYFTEYKDSL